MAKGLERVEKFEKEITKIDYFIEGATSFLYDHIEDPTTQEIIECSRAVAYSNLEYIEKRETAIEKMRQTMANATSITQSILMPPQPQKDHKPNRKKYKSIQEIVDLIKYSYLNEETMHILESQSHEDIVRIKLYFYKLIIETKKAIREIILNDPQLDIKKLQSDLETYTLIVDTISELEQKDENIVPIEDKEYSNIIFAPNGRRNTYFYDDVCEYLDKSKEIKKILEKIIDGYFLKTKDTKRIEGYQENLYEYKHPNGIRVLYIVEGNIIIICSLFIKDKQKSTRITNEYDEAIIRYYKVRDYVLENFHNPDFHIEQAELIGNIYQILERITLSKKVSDE